MSIEHKRFNFFWTSPTWTKRSFSSDSQVPVYSFLWPLDGENAKWYCHYAVGVKNCQDPYFHGPEGGQRDGRNTEASPAQAPGPAQQALPGPGVGQVSKPCNASHYKAPPTSFQKNILGIKAKNGGGGSLSSLQYLATCLSRIRL